VGKGKGGRALAHLDTDAKEAITKIVRKIRRSGSEPQIEILAHKLPNSEAALRIEASAIDLLGLKNLANRVHGHGTKFGRMPLNEVVAHYAQRRANVRESAALIRINQLYRYGMSDVELYDSTRGVWRIGPKREKAKYAIAVFEGIVREVYRITAWLPAGSTFNVRRGGRGVRSPERWEFVGTIAESRMHVNGAGLCC
jgi:hypothetical protein